ncbi:MAG TPA: hypothetical protein VK658_01635 [Chryseolinea sp.]|nr:hypothetical protein [Chryseolinea sp.]
MYIKSLTLFLCFLFQYFLPAAAQDEPSSFGDVSLQELQMSQYKLDTTAHAVMLFDKGVVKIDGNSMVGTVIRRSMRIKILHQDAVGKWADFEFGMPDRGDFKVEGITYNLVDGKTVTSKLFNSDVHFVREGKYYQRVTFALPNVRVGSVLEVSYTMKLSDFYLPSWTFQYTIPTVRSEYIIYGLFRLKPYLSGAIQPKHEVTKHNNTRNEYVLTDIPAFNEEPFMPDPAVYKAQVRFVDDTKWENIALQLMSTQAFYKAIEENKFLTEKVQELTKGVEGLQKVKVISDYVKATVAWNGIKDYLAYPLKDVLERKSGSAADINLLLASMLRKAGFDTQPVLVSTREHGWIEEELPSRSQFDYVVCQVTAGDREMIVDGTERALPFDLLPPRCFNHKGFLVSRKQYGWISIEPMRKDKVSITANLKVDDEGQLSGNVILNQDDYAAFPYRSAKTDSTKAPADIFGVHSGDLKLVSTENAKDVSKALIRKYELQPFDYGNLAGTTMYISPYPFLRKEENEFKTATREYPVDFGMISEKTGMFKFTLPKGFKTKELPKNENFGLPGNAAKFTLSVTAGTDVTIVARLQINKTLFMPDEYPALREFYSRVVAKMSEMIVLVKE